MTPEVYDTAYGFALSSIYDRLYAISADSAACVSTLASGTTSAAEYGIGTGRIAVPLAASGIDVSGVDLSPDFLALAAGAAAVAGVDVALTLGDMAGWQPPREVDLAYSVCASLTMLPSEEAIATTLMSMAGSLQPHGRVVIENHHPASVRELCTRGPAEITLAVADLPGGVSMAPALGDGFWTALLTWQESGRERRVLDRCLLVEPDRLAELAAAAGLREVARTGGWTDQALTAASPVYISTFRPIGHRADERIS